MSIENVSLRTPATQVSKAESTIKDAKQPAVFNNLKSSVKLDAVKENIIPLAQSQSDQLGEEWVSESHNAAARKNCSNRCGVNFAAGFKSCGINFGKKSLSN